MGKDTLKFGYVSTARQRLTVRGTYIPWTSNEPFVGTFDRAQWWWSRPNRTGAVSLNSVLSPTLLNEFTFSTNSDGKGDIQMLPECGDRCDRPTYGVGFPDPFPAPQDYEREIPTTP